MTHTNLIPVFNSIIANQAVQLCNARALHEFVESERQFANWITDRITDYGFQENEDYIIVTERTTGRPRKEYHITLDMGKELAMVERNEKGRQIRKYFIECERQALQKNNEIQPLVLPEKKYTIEFTESELEDLGWCWFEAQQMCEFIGKINPILRQLGSDLYPQTSSMHQEYGMHLKHIGKLIHRITQGIEFESRPFQKLHEAFTLKAELATR